MENNAHRNFANQYCPRFGEIAVDLGFITAMQLKEAMVERVEDNLSNKPHRFIGKILSEHGWITSEQIDIVLDTLSKAILRPLR